MDIVDFENLLDKSIIKIGDNGCVVFEPVCYDYGFHISQILKKYNMENLTPQSFSEIYKAHNPLYTARKKMKQKRADEFSTLTTKQVAELPMEEKLNYMEALFPPRQVLPDFLAVCEKNEQNIKACLYNMDFPKSFWDKEKQLAERFVSLIAGSPKIVEGIKDWENTSLEEKKEVIFETQKVYEYVYGIAPDVKFFTQEEERAKNIALGIDENAMISAAYASKGVVYFNLDQLQGSDNFYAVSTFFHEATHCRQGNTDFGDEIVNRIFYSDISNVTTYESVAKAQMSDDFRDLYTMSPSETHAYGIQQYMENALIEKTGINKVCYEAETKEVETVLNKAFTMAAITQVRSS